MFKNRKEAGQLLAQKLSPYKNKKDVIILAIPRGGVEVAHEVAKSLNLPLDIIVVKKIGFPGNEEFAIGAASVSSCHINEEITARFAISKLYLDEQIKLKQKEAKETSEILRGKKLFPLVKNKIITLIDDGIATGETILMASKIIKKQLPKKIIIAVPVGPKETCEKLRKEVDEVVCLLQPEEFMAIGQFYESFPQVENEQVRSYLKWKKK